MMNYLEVKGKGKINYDELSRSQRQYNDNSDIHSFFSPVPTPMSISEETTIPENELYNNVKCPKKAYYVFFFVIFGNCYFILKGYNLLKNILVIMIYILLSILLFFPMVFLNVLSLLLILIVKGFKNFIVKFDDLLDLHVEDFIVIFINVLIGNFCFIIFSWKRQIDKTHIDIYKKYMKFFIYFPCVIMSIIIYFPQRLLINIASIIIYFIFFKKFSFFDLIYDLNIIFEETFNFRV